MKIKLTRDDLIDVAIRAVLSALIFTSICAAGFFCAWIGGVQPFTAEAGFIAVVALIFASIFASITFIRP